MTDSIPALIAEARKAQRAVYLAAPEPVAEDLHRIIKGLADALESLSAPPATMTVDEAWQEHLNEHGYATVPVSAGTGADFYAGWEKREAAFRRPAPPASTDKQDDALIQAISHADTEAFISIADTNILTDAILAAGYRRVSPLTREALAEIIWDTSRADEGTISATGANIIADAILSRLSVPEPAEVEWEYGYNTGSTVTFVGDRAQIEEWTLVRGMAVGVGDWGSRIVRRRKTGPWVPVTPGGTK